MVRLRAFASMAMVAAVAVQLAACLTSLGCRNTGLTGLASAGALRVHVVWPSGDQPGDVGGLLIPPGTNSILVRLFQVGSELQDKRTVIRRLPDAERVQTTITGIPAGPTQLIITAHAANDGTGAVLTRWEGEVMIEAGLIAQLDIIQPARTWRVTQEGAELRIAYGSGADFPQYAVLHTDSSYFRLIHSRDAGWATSVILMPSFWEQGHTGPTQGAAVSVTWQVVEGELVLSFTGTISELTVQGEVRITPPGDNSLTAIVTVSEVTGEVVLADDRPGERFKPVMLSSMHISATQWDCQGAYVGAQTFPIPESGWIISPPVAGMVFGLLGGTSEWKTNAPTVEITLDAERPITGWVTASNNPNDDNVGLWAATDDLIRSWRYTVVARP